MSGIMAMLLGFAVGAVKDAYFNLVTLLLPGNGTNGAQNNTFLDSSTNNFTITRNGNTTQGTFSPFSQTGWSNLFDGSGDYLSSSHPAMNATWTIEAWVYRNSGGVNQSIVLMNNGGVSGILIFIDTSNNLNVNDGATGQASFTTVSVPINAWTHVAVVRSGGTTTGYVNGSVAGSNTFTPQTVSAARIGYYHGGDPMSFNGYISNFRVVNGTAVYTSAFTPPTSSLTAITNTSLLTCQSNGFMDNSSNAYAITRTGDVSIQAFSPFNPTAAYSAATVGGSGYFDGTGDYLQIAANSAFQFDADFTVECWFYSGTSTTANKYDQIIGTIESATAGYWRLGSEFNGGKQFWFTWTTGSYNDILTSFSVSDNAWHHLAVSRISNSVRLFVDGVQRGSTTTVTTNLNANAPLMIMNSTQGTNQTQGYVSSVRIIKGQGLYNGTFTPPTAPFTTSSVGSTGSGAASSITGTVSILTNFTNAGIFDGTMKNNLETVGNAQISTTQSKFGGSSMFFDGSGDYLLFPSSQNLAFGTGDYTVEAWVYFTSISGAALQIIFRSGGGGNNFYFHVDNDQISVGTGSAFISNQSTTFNTNTWYHIAACRSGTTLRLFRDGTQVGSSVTDNTNWVSTGTAGVGSNETGIQTVSGYIDDLRVSKYARYTSNFTPPTVAFPLQ